MSSQSPGQVLFEFVRHWSRRSVAEDRRGEQGRLVLVSEAVHSLTERGAAATVNAIAREIGIDQSGASRLIKSAATAGHLVMTTHTADGRRREAGLTPAGRIMLDQAHRWQEEIFAQLTVGWSEKRRSDVKQAMTDLMNQSYAMDV